jgi:hypothetical protein
LQAALLGFVAAALAVVIVHQGLVYGLGLLGATAWKPWSLAPIPPFGVPSLLSQMFWGGLWGALFALLWRSLPGGSLVLKGLLFGIAGPLVAGRWLLVPLLKGEPLFAGFNSNTMLVQAIIIPLFGAGLAWFYGRLSGAGQA